MNEHGHPTECSVGKWLEHIKNGRVALPRFQRGIVWKDSTIADMLLALLWAKPIGALLVLQRETSRTSLPFEPYPLRMAPNISGECDQLILDGQQRLTALWRSLTDTYDNENSGRSRRRFFIEVSGDIDDSLHIDNVSRELRSRSQKLLDSPLEQWKQMKIPISILGKPGVTQEKDDCAQWCDAACANDADKSRTLERRISELSGPFLSRDIAFYALKGVSRDEAITAFIKTNESSSKISRFDIAVAEIEKEKAESLRGLIENNIDIDPDRRDRFFGDDVDKRMKELGELVLKVSCLLNESQPSDSNYTDPRVISTVIDSWGKIIDGINFSLKILEKECFYDHKRLPSKVPLRVLPALFVKHEELLTDSVDKTAQAIRIIRKYIWRTFLTRRYDGSVDARLAEDHKVLGDNLVDISAGKDIADIAKFPKIFNPKEYEVPSKKDLSNLEMPISKSTSQNRLFRALMGISLRGGARDIATDRPVDMDNIRKRQYHHLFPDKLLKEEGRPDEVRNHALNFALISAKTNNKLQAQPPIDYLKRRLELNPSLSEEELMKRLHSHRIPYDALKVENGKSRRYENFLRRRAEMFEEAILALSEGGDC